MNAVNLSQTNDQGQSELNNSLFCIAIIAYQARQKHAHALALGLTDLAARHAALAAYFKARLDGHHAAIN